MPEIVLNLHMHTCFSDGTGTHEEIAQAALSTGLDAVIVTDHNVYVDGPEGYYYDGKRRVLLVFFFRYIRKRITICQLRLPKKKRVSLF